MRTILFTKPLYETSGASEQHFCRMMPRCTCYHEGYFGDSTQACRQMQNYTETVLNYFNDKFFFQ